MTDIWDVEHPELKGREPVCPKLWKAPKPFKKVFSNGEYVLLKV